MLRMKVLLMIRYRVDFVAQIITMYLFFVVLFFGGRAAVGSVSGGGAGVIGDTLDAIIVGWFLWTMAVSSYSSLSSEVTQESRWGTLEQLFMTPHGFGVVLTTKVVVNVLTSLLMGGIMLSLMIVTTGRTFTVDLLSVVPIVILTLMTTIGLGYVLAGLTLVYKKISSVRQIAQFGLVGLIAAPAVDVPMLRVLPLVQGSAMLQETMREGVRFWHFPMSDIAVLVGTALVYWAIGYAIFMFCSRVARKRGVMAHY